jgi:hypothetical protein
MLGFLIFLPQFSSAESSSANKNLPEVQLNSNGLTQSKECGKCHKEIYSAWKNSLHAKGIDNPVFWTAYLKASFKGGEAARNKCLTCHAPIARLTGDSSLVYPLTHESINCDYCHTITDIKTSDPEHFYRHTLGLTKQGPLQDARSPLHETKYNALFVSSQYCAGCHEYQDENGNNLIETYSEWKAGPYPAEGITCQSCHMKKYPGSIVDKAVAPSSRNEISAHDFAGGHSLSMRAQSLTLSIENVRIVRQKISITVLLTNQGAGHKIPTGLPSKKLILQVSVKSKNGDWVETQQRTYQKVIVDPQGNRLNDDADIMMGKGARIVTDNRIAPREKRQEKFVFFVPEGEGDLVSATTWYSHDPEVIQASPIRIKMNEASHSLRSQ